MYRSTMMQTVTGGRGCSLAGHSRELCAGLKESGRAGVLVWVELAFGMHALARLVSPCIHVQSSCSTRPPLCRSLDCLRYEAATTHDISAATLASFELQWQGNHALGAFAWAEEAAVCLVGPYSARKPVPFRAILPSIGVLPEGECRGEGGSSGCGGFWRAAVHADGSLCKPHVHTCAGGKARKMVEAFLRLVPAAQLPPELLPLLYTTLAPLPSAGELPQRYLWGQPGCHVDGVVPLLYNSLPPLPGAGELPQRRLIPSFAAEVPRVERLKRRVQIRLDAGGDYACGCMWLGCMWLLCTRECAVCGVEGETVPGCGCST